MKRFLKPVVLLIALCIGQGMLWSGCASSGNTGQANTSDDHTAISSIGIPYGSTIRCVHPSLSEPLVGYFHEYREQALVLNTGVVPYDSNTQVEIMGGASVETAICDTLERDGQWSILAEGQWVTLYGLHGNRVARGRVNLVLPETLYVDDRHISQDSVCRMEVAWRQNSDHRHGFLAIPYTIGKTIIKVAGLPPVLLWSLVSDNAQPLKRWMNW